MVQAFTAKYSSQNLFALTQDAKEVNEEVDEVEIKREGTEKSQLLRSLTSIGGHLEHLLNLLRVVSRQSYEYQNTLTSDAMIKPMSAISSIFPIEVRSVFVVYPTKAITAKVPAVMKNTLAMEDAV